MSLSDLFRPSSHFDVCTCNHPRKIHGELFLVLTYDKISKDSASEYGCFADDNLRHLCSCLKFEMDNLKTLEVQYTRRSKWKALLNF